MRCTIKILITIFLCSLGANSDLYAQSDFTQSVTRAGETRYQGIPYYKRIKYVYEDVQDLKKGTLIVRLMTLDKKINFLKDKGRNKEANELKMAVDSFNIDFMAAVKKDYDFSTVRFAYGAEIEKFLNKEETNIFLNKRLKASPKIKIKEGPIFILAAQSGDNFYLFDQNYERIPQPAPHSINLKPTKRYNGVYEINVWYELIIGAPAYLPDVTYFNRKLHRLHSRAVNGRRSRR